MRVITALFFGACLLLPAAAGAAAPHFVVDSWGSEGGGPGELDWPVDLDVDGQGNVYVVDYHNNRINKFNQEGRLILSWNGDGLFDTLSGIAVDPDGYCWVTDPGREVIEKFDLYGNRLVSRIVPPAPGKTLSSPVFVAVGPTGEAFVLDNFGGGIHHFGPSGDNHAFWSISSSTGTTDLAVDPAGDVWVLNLYSSTVTRYSPGGVLRSAWQASQPNGARVKLATSIDVSDTGEVYVLSRDSGAEAVYRYSRSGVLLSRSSLSQASPRLPVALAVDWTDNLWVADRGAPRITRLAPRPAATHILQSSSVPGYLFEVRIAQGPGRSIFGAKEGSCIPETLCVSGAVPGRSEVFVRIVGPKGNGKLWPTLVKFSTSTIEVWIQQVSTGQLRYYRLPGAAPGVDELPGTFDRQGYDP